MQNKFSLCVIRMTFTTRPLVFIRPNSPKYQLCISWKLVRNRRPWLWKCFCVFVFSSASDWKRTENSLTLVFLLFSSSLSPIFLFSIHSPRICANFSLKLNHFSLTQMRLRIAPVKFASLTSYVFVPCQNLLCVLSENSMRPSFSQRHFSHASLPSFVSLCFYSFNNFCLSLSHVLLSLYDCIRTL